MSETIDYGNLMHRAMRGLIQEVLNGVRDNGLPGAHHFFITFDTKHPDARLADWLRERYPGDMTVVMQHWYDNLEVGDDGFAVTLNFGDAPEDLYVPYDAIQTFVDPSVEFGLRFEQQIEEEDDDDLDDIVAAVDADDTPGTAPAKAPAKTPAKSPPKPPAKAPGEVVSLDSFRKP